MFTAFFQHAQKLCFFVLLFSLLHTQAAYAALNSEESQCFTLLKQNISSTTPELFLQGIDTAITADDVSEQSTTTDTLTQVAFADAFLERKTYKTGERLSFSASDIPAYYSLMDENKTSDDIAVVQANFFNNANTNEFLHCSFSYIESLLDKGIQDFDVQSDASSVDSFNLVKVESVIFEARKYKKVYVEQVIRSPGAKPVATRKSWYLVPENNYNTFNPYSLVENFQEAFTSYEIWRKEVVDVMQNTNNYDVIYDEAHRFSGEQITIKQINDNARSILATKNMMNRLGGIPIITLNEIPFSSMASQALIDMYISSAMVAQKQSYALDLSEISRKGVISPQKYIEIRTNQIDEDFSPYLSKVSFLESYLDSLNAASKSFGNEEMYQVFATLNHFRNTTDSKSDFRNAAQNFLDDPNAALVELEDLGKNEVKNKKLPAEGYTPSNGISPLALIGGFVVFFFILRLFKRKKK